MKSQWNLYRKRYLPDEIVHLKDDIILYQDEQRIVTSWETLKPRKDIKRGISAYFTGEGIKVSKVFNARNEVAYWYCDIIRTEKIDSSLIFHDLLVDIIVYSDGFVKVVDLNELGQLLSAGKIDAAFVSDALTKANRLLSLIYDNSFGQYQAFINKFDQ
ncbi:MAG: DUF402 domain-containing protein [Acetivibrio ethanolgignens]